MPEPHVIPKSLVGVAILLIGAVIVIGVVRIEAARQTVADHSLIVTTPPWPKPTEKSALYRCGELMTFRTFFRKTMNAPSVDTDRNWAGASGESFSDVMHRLVDAIALYQDYVAARLMRCAETTRDRLLH